MAGVGLDLGKADVGRYRVERLHDLPAVLGGEQPVGGERDDAEPHRRVAEGVGHHAAVLLRHVEVVHGPGDIQVRIGVEAVDEGDPLVAQVAFHLEVGVETVGDGVAVLQPAAEPPVQRHLRHVGDVRRHARHGEPPLGMPAVVQVIPAAPVRVRHDGLAADLVEGDVLRRMAHRGGDGHGGEDAGGVERGPFQRLHAAQGAAEDREHLFYPQVIEQHRLGADHVADGDDGEFQAPGLAGLRVDLLRPGGSHAAAQDIDAKDAVTVRIQGLARAHHQLPPARLAGHRMDTGGELVAGQRVADQDDVGLVLVELPIGHVGDREVGQLDPAVQAQRLLPAQPHLGAGQGRGVEIGLRVTPRRGHVN